MITMIMPTIKLLLFALGIYTAFSATNWIFGANNSVKEGHKFSWNKFFSGIGRAAIIYVAVALTTVGAALLPELNARITEVFGKALISEELIGTVSALGVLTAIISGIGIQAKNAFGKIFEWFSIDRNQKFVDEIVKEITQNNLETKVEDAIVEQEAETLEKEIENETNNEVIETLFLEEEPKGIEPMGLSNGEMTLQD